MLYWFSLNTQIILFYISKITNVESNLFVCLIFFGIMGFIYSAAGGILYNTQNCDDKVSMEVIDMPIVVAVIGMLFYFSNFLSIMSSLLWRYLPINMLGYFVDKLLSYLQLAVIYIFISALIISRGKLRTGFQKGFALLSKPNIYLIMIAISIVSFLYNYAIGLYNVTSIKDMINLFELMVQTDLERKAQSVSSIFLALGFIYIFTYSAKNISFVPQDNDSECEASSNCDDVIKNEHEPERVEE